MRFKSNGQHFVYMSHLDGTHNRGPGALAFARALLPRSVSALRLSVALSFLDERFKSISTNEYYCSAKMAEI